MVISEENVSEVQYNILASFWSFLRSTTVLEVIWSETENRKSNCVKNIDTDMDLMMLHEIWDAAEAEA